MATSSWPVSQGPPVSLSVSAGVDLRAMIPMLDAPGRRASGAAEGRICRRRARGVRRIKQKRGTGQMIKVGDQIPSMTLTKATAEGPKPVTTDEIFKGRKVVLFAVPGAFTPTCSAKHLPGFVQNIDALKAKGVDEVVCMAVNDAFVMGAWGRDQKTGGKVRMMADGSATFTQATGLTLDLTARGMGLRSNRYSMLVKDGVVKTLNVEAPGKFEVSDADTMLAQVRAQA